MRILFVADLHYVLRQFDWVVANASKFDLIIIGGDLLDLASPLEFDVQILVIEKYLERIKQKTCLVVSSGNHDGDARSEFDESVCRWIHESKGERIFVDGDSLELPGALVTICPWWDGPQSRAELLRQLERDAQKVRGHWIWIHHAPPSGSPVCWTGKKSGGDEFLREWIERFKPSLVLSGHIHNSPFYADGSWIDRINDTWVFNPGKQIGPCPTSIILDLDTMSAEWTSIDAQSVRQLALVES